MTQQQFRVSRRKVLAGLGTIGVASAGAGLGTTAFFSDTESLQGWMQAGQVDLKVDYRTTYKPWLSAAEVEARADEFFKNSSGRRVYPVAGDPMSLHVGSAPPVGTTGFELTADDEAPSHEAWKNATLAANACDEDSADYIGDSLVDGDTEVFVDLMDIKPYDEGETTFSLHLCGNPSLISMRADVLGTPENALIEPEESSGDETDDDGSQFGFAGELQHYLWLEAWADDCDNLLNNEEEPFYQGSLAGFLDFVGDDFQIPFAVNGSASNGVSGASVNSGVDVDLPNAPFTDFSIDTVKLLGNGNANLECEELDPDLLELERDGADSQVDAGELAGLNTPKTFTFEAQDGNKYDVTITVTELKDGEPVRFDWSITQNAANPGAPDLGIEAVIIKDGNMDNEGNGGIRVYNYEDAFSDTGLTAPTNTKLKGISNIRFCYDDDGNGGGNGGGGTQETPECIQGVRCWAFRWYLPCKDDDATNLGFSDLPSDAATVDFDGDGEMTLADELIAAGLAERDDNGDLVLDENDNPIPLGINVVQTDGVHFTLHFDAVQCRHNPDAMPMEDETAV